MKIKTKLFTAAVTILMLSVSARASIVGISDNFSTSTGTFSNWVSVGAVRPYPNTRVTSGNYDYNDGNTTVTLAYSVGMLQTGDGVYNDGGLRLDTVDAVAGNEAMGLTIGGTMKKGEQLTFAGNFYNNNSSFTSVGAQLWNLTDDRLLAQTLSGVIQAISGTTSTNYAPVDFSVKYTVSVSDDGDVLQLRFSDTGGTATARDIFVDNFNLTTVPPSLKLLIITN